MQSLLQNPLVSIPMRRRTLTKGDKDRHAFRNFFSPLPRPRFHGAGLLIETRGNAPTRHAR